MPGTSQISHLGFVTYFTDRKTKSEKLVDLLSFVWVLIMLSN